MSYLGSPPASQFFAPGTDTFSGDGTTVAFTLSRNVATVNDILVVVNNVDQQPSAYTVLGSTLTLSAAPSAGTNNIYVRYLSTNLTAIVPQYGSVVPSSLSTPNALYWDTSGNVGVGTTTPTAMAGKSLQVSDRSAFYQLTVNNSTYLANNLYYDGTNWRYITTGLGVFLVLDSSGSTAFYRAASGTAGAVATIIATSLIDASSNFSFNSGYGSVATAYGCRAWVNFNGTGTVAIRSSANVSSITDNATGVYTVNFSNAMPAANYSTSFSCNGVYNGSVMQLSDTAGGDTNSPNFTVNAFTMSVRGNGTITSLTDAAFVTASVFR